MPGIDIYAVCELANGQRVVRRLDRAEGRVLATYQTASEAFQTAAFTYTRIETEGEKVDRLAAAASSRPINPATGEPIVQESSINRHHDYVHGPNKIWSDDDVRRLQDEMLRIQRENVELKSKVTQTDRQRNLIARRLKKLDELVATLTEGKEELLTMFTAYGEMEKGAERVWNKVFEAVDETTDLILRGYIEEDEDIMM